MACTTEYLEQPFEGRRHRAGWRGALPRLWLKLHGWYERAQQRRQLGGLSDYALKDIGVSRVDALREAAKPFWRS